jgi:predicted dehydrogenase
MANRHAELYAEIPGVELVAACDVDRIRVDAFAAKHSIPASGVFTDFAKLLRECPCDAVSNVTPDAFHAAQSIQCLRAGKHVLCEKPLCASLAELDLIREVNDLGEIAYYPGRDAFYNLR